MAIQRNVLVAPFSVKTPLLSTRSKRNDEDELRSGVSRPQIKWLQSLPAAINNSVQIGDTVPAHSNSLGQPGTIAFDATGLYLCVGLNTWIKFIGAPF